MEVDSGPVRHATKDLLRKKIANPYVSGKGFKGQGKGFKGQGKGRSYTEAGRSSTETRPSQYRGRPVASKVMDFPMTPVEEVMKLRLCIEEQPVYGVTDSHAPIAQASMETECTNDCEFIADNAPMANIQACPIPQFQQINPFPQTVQAYAQASNVQDVDLRRRVSSPQTVQSLRPQTLQTIGQAASQTTRPFTKRDMIKQQLVQLMLRANSTQLQQIIPESPVYQDCPAALMPNFDLLK
ncbi:hypothetical protein MAR_006508 [Mya arenaria]|uniref:Uncharacterized protein n=2 Tax=Mya arenaria TaxID=6604 RepID=A0ABY7DB83_MYAAR|nr:hypothetical protein MAR_006508 [Mya arenaria]